MRLILIRRAETDSNVVLRHGGRDAVPLNARGRHQAEQAAVRLRSYAATALYTSDLTRAAETAAIIGAALGLAPQSLGALREIDGGSEPLTPEELYRRFPDQIQAFARDPARPVRPGGESYMQLHARAAQALDVFARHGDITVLAVSHGGVIRAMLHAVIGLDLSAFPRLVLDPCGLTELRTSAFGWRLHHLNDATQDSE